MRITFHRAISNRVGLLIVKDDKSTDQLVLLVPFPKTGGNGCLIAADWQWPKAQTPGTDGGGNLCWSILGVQISTACCGCGVPAAGSGMFGKLQRFRSNSQSRLFCLH